MNGNFDQQNETKVQLKKFDGKKLTLDKSKLGKEERSILEAAKAEENSGSGD